MVDWALSIGLIDLPFSHWTHVTFKHHWHPARAGGGPPGQSPGGPGLGRQPQSAVQLPVAVQVGPTGMMAAAVLSGDPSHDLASDGAGALTVTVTVTAASLSES
jgi:hypothetical protein